MIKDSTDKGLLVVSFGTTHGDTCKETIGAIEAHLAKAMPDRRLYRGWTSSFIIRKLRERDGIEIDTVGEALDRMASEGVRDLLVVPTHLLPGAEYDKVMASLEVSDAALDRSDAVDRTFEKIVVSGPLLDTGEDLKRLTEVIASELLRPSTHAPARGSDALVLMGHGSADKPEVNEIYIRLEEEFRRTGHDNVFIGTVEGSPSIDEVTRRLKDWIKTKRSHLPKRDPELHKQVATDWIDEDGSEMRSEQDSMTVRLAPLMIVAGDHAINDMAGDDSGSWKNRIEEALKSAASDARASGARVPSVEDTNTVTPSNAASDVEVSVEMIPIIRGLGSYTGVQSMFLEKAKSAHPVHEHLATQT